MNKFVKDTTQKVDRPPIFEALLPANNEKTKTYEWERKLSVCETQKKAAFKQKNVLVVFLRNKVCEKDKNAEKIPT